MKGGYYNTNITDCNKDYYCKNENGINILNIHHSILIKTLQQHSLLIKEQLDNDKNKLIEIIIIIEQTLKNSKIDKILNLHNITIMLNIVKMKKKLSEKYIASLDAELNTMLSQEIVLEWTYKR